MAATPTSSRHWYEMATCPAGDLFSDAGRGPNCGLPQVCAAGVCNGAASNDSVPDAGMSLTQMTGYRLSICAGFDDGGTTGAPNQLGDAGVMLAQVYLSGTGAWSWDPKLNQDLLSVPTYAGRRCTSWPDFTVGGQFDRVRFVASGVTTYYADGGAGGNTLDVLIDGQYFPR